MTECNEIRVQKGAITTIAEVSVAAAAITNVAVVGVAAYAAYKDPRVRRRLIKKAVRLTERSIDRITKMI